LVVCPSDGRDTAKKPMAGIIRATRRIIFRLNPDSDRFDRIFFYLFNLGTYLIYSRFPIGIIPSLIGALWHNFIIT
jgi:hypothetical protein